MISRLDREVGDLLDLLDELALADDTIVVFTSDNGPTHVAGEVDVEFFRSGGGLRGLKGSLYEGGIRVPCIVRWPGRVAAGTTSVCLSGFEDWLPTFAAAAGAAVPPGIDGIDLLPALTAPAGQRTVPREFLYREFPAYGGQQSLHAGRWKVVRQGLLPRKAAATRRPAAIVTELYDLEADPAESRDVAAEHPEVVVRLEAVMARERVPSGRFPIPVLDAAHREAMGVGGR